MGASSQNVAYVSAAARALAERPEREALTSAKQRKLQAKVAVARHVRKLRGLQGGDALGPAVAEFQRQFQAQVLPQSVRTALATLRPRKADQCPDRATLYRWDRDYTAYLQGDAKAPAPRHRGRRRRHWGWEARALQLWQQPTRPEMATVAYWLREEGWESAEAHRVRRFLQSLPETMGEHSAKRMGRHYYGQNLRPYTPRDETVVPVGMIYEGDGHTCDVYVAHPLTGHPWRPELTVWLDVRSHYCVGWYLSEGESARSTLFGLSHAIVHHDHVPGGIHVDPGSGFVNRVMTDEVVGYCARLAIEPMAALPGNAKGKGLVEGFFRIFERRCGKRFATYCAHDRTDDYLRHLSRKVQRGEITLPTLAQYRDAIAEFIEAYNRTVQRRLGCAPAALWAELERVAVVVPREAIVRPRELRTVRRWMVHIHHRMYRAGELAEWNGRQVMVEYDLHDDRTVTIRDRDGRFVCEAELVDRKPWLPVSRIEEMQRNRLAGQAKRLQDKLEEAQERSGQLITHDQVLEEVEALSEPHGRLEEKTGERSGHSLPGDRAQGDDVSLDIFDTDY